MERFTPLYTIMDSMENLRFDKEGYFHDLVVVYGLFYKMNRKHPPPPPVFPYVIETLVEVWQNAKLRGKTRPVRARVPTSISFFSQTSTRASRWKMFLIS